MAMNYYAIEEGKRCPTCGEGIVSWEKHIGKSSAGWCFSLMTYPAEGINRLEDWEVFLQDKEIRDENWTPITLDELLHIISGRKFGRPEKNPEWFEQNNAEPGPNNLARHTIDGAHCIAHGEGTWDYMIGEFS